MKIIAGSFRNKITYRSVGYDPYAGAVKTGDVKDPAIARLLDAGERAVFKKTLPCAPKRSFRHNRTASVRAVIQFRLCDEDGAEDGRFLGFAAFPVWPRCAGRWSITVSVGETMS